MCLFSLQTCAISESVASVSTYKLRLAEWKNLLKYSPHLFHRFDCLWLESSRRRKLQRRRQSTLPFGSYPPASFPPITSSTLLRPRTPSCPLSCSHKSRHRPRCAATRTPCRRCCSPRIFGPRSCASSPFAAALWRFERLTAFDQARKLNSARIASRKEEEEEEETGCHCTRRASGDST